MSDFRQKRETARLPEVTRVAEESLCVIYNNLRDATVVGSKTPEARRAITVMTRLGGGFTSSAALLWLQKPLERFLGRVRALQCVPKALTSAQSRAFVAEG
ncbi:hypothetical protein GGX14DRAFT_407736 [Mycena pura]|uniref:Uncharacterized protein n=1 Tax=Mycena pura TaxID=153505 RepID=A0AAD6Y1Z4_9AGAR|nr:hypothetical protein GGX14DRAFT_407736 [Mycena pura]